MKYTVALGERAYDIHLTRGGIHRLSTLFDLDRRVLVLTDAGVPEEYARAVAAQCREGHILTVPMGEGSKSFDTLKSVEETLLSLNFGRRDAVVAVGGGVVGDLAGFAASIYMRGIDFYNVPTTVLSAVDSSVGGKCAINFGAVKNVIGSFYQPKGVMIDPELLYTLPKRQVANGLAEVVKISLTSDKGLFEKMEGWEPSLDTVDELLFSAVLNKAHVVERDERESGERKILNFGHTIGHAIESATGMSALYHGECVALGMLPMCSDAVRERLAKVLKKLDLPTAYEYDREAACGALSHDKKRHDASVDCVVVERVGEGEIRPIPLATLCKMIKEGMTV